MLMASRRLALVAAVILGATIICRAQDKYEIQVYGAQTVPAGSTMVELHSNFTFEGAKTVENGVLPTEHELHETIEVTQGWNDWFETGFYIFTAVPSGQGWQWVGDHIRPRVRVPDRWHWPVGASLSLEFGYARPNFSTSVWSLEIRPIVDRQKGRLYWAINPALERAYTGPASSQGWEFSPDAKISWNFTKPVAVGLEYYSGLGPLDSFDAFPEQSQQLFRHSISMSRRNGRSTSVSASASLVAPTTCCSRPSLGAASIGERSTRRRPLPDFKL